MPPSPNIFSYPLLHFYFFSSFLLCYSFPFCITLLSTIFPPTAHIPLEKPIVLIIIIWGTNSLTLALRIVKHPAMPLLLKTYEVRVQAFGHGTKITLLKKQTNLNIWQLEGNKDNRIIRL